MGRFDGMTKDEIQKYVKEHSEPFEFYYSLESLRLHEYDESYMNAIETLKSQVGDSSNKGLEIYARQTGMLFNKKGQRVV